MSDVKQKLSEEELKGISGGNEGKFTDISQCPPGTRDMKNDFPDDAYNGYSRCHTLKLFREFISCCRILIQFVKSLFFHSSLS